METINTILFPQKVERNSDTSLLKLIAVITMLIDHLGAVIFPGHYWMRMIGRMALPIYAYCIAAGCVYTKNHARYAARIALAAMISQPIYAVSMHHTTARMKSVDFSGSSPAER